MVHRENADGSSVTTIRDFSRDVASQTLKTRGGLEFSLTGQNESDTPIRFFEEIRKISTRILLERGASSALSSTEKILTQ